MTEAGLSNTAVREQAGDAERRDLPIAGRILDRHGVVDAFGHVSARHPARADRFLMSRRLAPALVMESDILEFGMDGELADRSGTPVFLERFIHSAIYSRRPDVMAIVHSHSPKIIAFGVVPTVELRPVCHTCGFLDRGAPRFDVRDTSGDGTDLLIRNGRMGDDLAEALGDANVVLMRGHGSTVVGGSIAQAVYRAIYTELNAQIQATAMGLGAVEYLSQVEAEAVARGEHLQIERTWEMWKRLVDAKGRHTDEIA